MAMRIRYSRPAPPSGGTAIAAAILSILGALVYYDGTKEYQEAFRKMAANTAKEIMTEPIISVNVEDDLGKVGSVILDHHIKRVPVLEKGKLVGVISRSDLVKMMLE